MSKTRGALLGPTGDRNRACSSALLLTLHTTYRKIRSFAEVPAHFAVPIRTESYCSHRGRLPLRLAASFAREPPEHGHQLDCPATLNPARSLVDDDDSPYYYSRLLNELERVSSIHY